MTQLVDALATKPDDERVQAWDQCGNLRPDPSCLLTSTLLTVVHVCPPPNNHCSTRVPPT